MDVRDAVEADAGALAAIADAPVDAMRNLIHDRSVRVAVADETDTDPNVDTDTDEAAVLGFVSFDARRDAVHVTQLDGTPDACERLLADPISFARQEGMTVELLVPEDETDVRSAAERVGFDERGNGPRFAGGATVRYRMEP